MDKQLKSIVTFKTGNSSFWNEPAKILSIYVICSSNHPWLQEGYAQLHIIKIGIDINSLSVPLLGRWMIYTIKFMEIYWKTCSNQNRLSKAAVGPWLCEKKNIWKENFIDYSVFKKTFQLWDCIDYISLIVN